MYYWSQNWSARTIFFPGELVKDREYWSTCLETTEEKINQLLGTTFKIAANSTFMPPFDEEIRYVPENIYFTVFYVPTVQNTG